MTATILTFRPRARRALAGAELLAAIPPSMTRLRAVAAADHDVGLRLAALLLWRNCDPNAAHSTPTGNDSESK